MFNAFVFGVSYSDVTFVRKHAVIDLRLTEVCK